jgi:membrane-bound lytic murein transglycosylase B
MPAASSARKPRRIVAAPHPAKRSLVVLARRFCLAVVLVLAIRPAFAEEQDFPTWLEGVKQEALQAGIQPATVARALDGLEPIPRVIELDQQQPETVRTYEQYLKHVVSRDRRRAARRQLAENRALLKRVAERYGVQPRFIVALWGIETSYGGDSGRFPVIGALATLAYEGRRGPFFRAELLNALRIVDQDGLDPAELLGSWAGAMGQAQFMPSTFLAYAVSYSGDGNRDIWHRREDVFASMANYLQQIGWHADQSWGQVVRLPKTFDRSLLGLDTVKTLKEWRALGVRTGRGGPLPAKELTASVLRPGGGEGRTILVYDNFRVLLKWNNSSYFASAVGFLADSMD